MSVQVNSEDTRLIEQQKKQQQYNWKRHQTYLSYDLSLRHASDIKRT